MRATWKLWNQKSFDSEPFLFARMAALCPRVLLQKLIHRDLWTHRVQRHLPGFWRNMQINPLESIQPPSSPVWAPKHRSRKLSGLRHYRRWPVS